MLIMAMLVMPITAVMPPVVGIVICDIGRSGIVSLAAIFGPAVLARYALGSLSIADAERRGSELLGAPVRAAVCAHPEIAVNVDRASDVRLAERALRA